MIATVVATGALAGAAVGLASEKQEPDAARAPAAEKGWEFMGGAATASATAATARGRRSRPA